MITKIQSLNLPSTLPDRKAMAAFQQNSGAYEPIFWEMEYQTHPYLLNMSTPTLIARHTNIISNIQRLYSRLATHYPSPAFQSAWYWLRKEYHTRLECHSRGIYMPTLLSDVKLEWSARTDQESILLGEPKKLYRYTSLEYAKDFLYNGRVRAAPSNIYGEIKNDSARSDDETTKTIVISGNRVKVTDAYGNEIKNVGEVNLGFTGPNYHLLCLSCSWDERLFDDFGSTHCIIIHEIEEFIKRLEIAGYEKYQGWDFYHNPAFYFDPYEHSLKFHIDHGTHKDFKFSYQDEYRFIWGYLGIDPLAEAQFLELGSLTDIAEIAQKPSYSAERPDYKLKGIAVNRH